MPVRLQKYLAECGVASRRKCEELITAGRVRVNGTVAKLGTTVEPGQDAILLDGQSVAIDEKIHVVLNKPYDVITSVTDTHGRETVIDCLTPKTFVQNPGESQSPSLAIDARVFPVGRLDFDTRGVLLLTNDGELANRLMHPRYEIPKVYLAELDGAIKPAAVRKLEQGVELADGTTAPAKVEVLQSGPTISRVRMTLREGKKREVKRMCAKVGYPVIDLERESMAGIAAGGLRLGEWRYLSSQEVHALRVLTGLVRDEVPRA